MMEAIDSNEKNVAQETEKRKHSSGKISPKNKTYKKQKILKKAERPGYGPDRFDETDYYFEAGLRKVRPYYYTFTAYCKGRWLEKKLIDVFQTEFLALPLFEFEKRIKSGDITVNNLKVEPDYILKNSDLISHIIHRHEVPVIDQPIKIIHVSDSLVVVDKPCSIPVHPCGRYRNNTVVFILGKDHNLRDLRIAYRLDRLTSGLMMFSRTLEQDKKLKQEICNRLVKKQYLCRVEGVFPEELIVCDEPIEVFNHKLGICKVGKNGKESKTEFERLSCNGISSVVLCKPHTGRMHQIRVHLQYLGYPILNDPLYNNQAFGPEKGKNGIISKSEEELLRDLLLENAELQWQLVNETESNPVSDLEIPNLSTNLSDSTIDNLTQQPTINVNSKYYDSNCALCLGKVKYQDPKPSQLMMYLHCWKYEGPDWKFETEKPKWASEDWKDEMIKDT